MKKFNYSAPTTPKTDLKKLFSSDIPCCQNTFTEQFGDITWSNRLALHNLGKINLGRTITRIRTDDASSFIACLNEREAIECY